MDTTHWKSNIQVIRLILLTLWIAWAQGQSDITGNAISGSQELAEKVEVNVVSTAYTLAFKISDGTEYAIDSVTCRNGSGTETKANEAHVCESLDPCTFYTCVVSFRASDVGNPPLPDQTIYAYTEYKQPRTTMTSVVPTANTIKVTWQTTDRACVALFKIEAKAADTYSTEQLNDKSTHTFRGVKSCLMHTITLVTHNNASQVVDQDTENVDTLYAEPGDIAMNITNLANGITVVKWGDPSEENCISNYVFKWRRDDCIQEPETTTTEEPMTTTADEVSSTDASTEEPSSPAQPEYNSVECEWSDVSADGKLREYLLTDLQGCELYTFQLFTNENATAKSSQQFTSAEKVSSAVFEPSHVSNTTELRWTWSAPQDHPRCVANYSVMLSGPSQRPANETRDLVTLEKVAAFDNLDPCGIYTVEIVPILLNGSSGSRYQDEGTVSEDQPTQILEPVLLPDSFSLELTWLTPVYADLCIDGYRLSGWMDDVTVVEVEALSVTTQNTSVVFSNLLACQVYIIQIIPYTRESMDGQLRQVAAETRPAIVDTSKITLQPTGKGSASHSLELSANNADYNNTCLTIFAFFNCSTTSSVRNPSAERYVEGHSKRGFQAKLSPLSPYTYYSCSVTLYNVAGPSPVKTIHNLQTETYFPEQPENVQFIGSTRNSLHFNWSQPTYLNGPIKYYQVFLMRHEASYFVPEDCPAIVEDSKPETKGDLNANFTGLAPSVRYIMQVAAQNDFGMGDYTAPVIGTTRPTVSDNVTQLSVLPQGPANDNNEYNANVTITWTVPCKSNGEIEYFQLSFSGSRANYNPVAFQRRVALDTENLKGRMSYTETDMLPQYAYTVQVAVKNREVEELSGSVPGSWESPAGLPAVLSKQVVDEMKVIPQQTNHPTKSAVVRLPAEILQSDSGEITYIALLLSSCADAPKLEYNVGDSWPNVLNYEQAGGDGTGPSCILQYQTTEERWQPVVTTRERQSRDVDLESLEIVFTIGTDKCNEGKRFCNGPLRPDTEYNMVVRLFTKSGYSDAAVVYFKTEAALKVTLILVSVCSCLLLAFVIGLAVLWVRKRMAWHRDSGQGIEDPFGNVIAKNFAIFYAEVAKPEKLAREFKEITVQALELSYAASELGCHKNRYADIYPYDKNRVILDIDAEGSDYINASFIDGDPRKKEYIATQGPKPESIMDFWRMVLQYNVRVIVQVTQFRENDMIKCHEYFPYTMRGLTVTIKSKEVFELYDRTELSVIHDKYGLKEKVIHFYFKKWPDHGCPADPMHLITFVKKVKAERRPSYSPIVVHCSAGVGRTGTFIGLDLIMQRLKSESKINIFETVKKLRFQRMKMVQTLQQYTFLYACTYELVKQKIPRAALKLEGRPKSQTIPPLAAPKKVSFPDVEVGSGEAEHQVSSAPNADNIDVPTLQLPARFSGLRKSTSPSTMGSNEPSTSSSNM
ncbi:phosphatidylinositol phosphatase PTPRQ isoform X1 [Drosophila serrata]|uniref:phosphatidylinositol phosphatase PTPRQ isoform X1 n=1 Tax=Drosophila serrata TaxID=7274 RepID=UPI000A1D2271|nr:phosphatidylinositol phosphatase PTPRQ isoform X1 [Drosophila serrata]XP_020798310.1 phosphatidylinositol phosphatase PTPRQ isoform X1 [Drosophila serrata]